MARLSLYQVAHRMKRQAFRLVLGCVSVLPFTMIASCLVTSTPDFRAPAQTAPLLEANGAIPDVRSIVTLPVDQKNLTFSAPLRSEDANVKVSVILYTDYGIENGSDKPFADSQRGTTLNASHAVDSAVRLAHAEWDPRNTSAGCHTVTMLVTHELVDPIECPADINDSSYLTWTVYVCPDAACSLKDVDLSTCPVATRACPARADGVGGAGAVQ